MLPDRDVRSVRSRCSRLGLVRGSWSDDEVAVLHAWYAEHEGAPLDIDGLVKVLGRSHAAISVKASRLGLTDPRRTTGRKDRRKFKGDAKAVRQHLSKSMKKHIRENGHPRGMKGKRQTLEARRRISETQKNQVALGMHHSQHVEMSQAQRDDLSKRMVERLKNGGNIYSRVRSGRRADLGDMFFRSAWEANYARYLRFLKERGEIQEWEFEPDTFWFEKIRRGTRSYTPDFKITDKHGRTYYVEVKGWMDAKSKTKLKRMKKYHPHVEIRVFGRKEYAALKNQLGAALPGWE